MNRRGFLGSILALGAAPAIVRADSLMRIVAPATTVQTLEWYAGYEKIEVVSGPSLSEIIAATLRAPHFAANIQARNRLIARLSERHEWQTISPGDLLLHSPTR